MQSAAVSEEAARMRDEMATQLGQVRVQRSSACDRADTAIAALRIAEAEKQELKKSIDAQIQAAVSAARADFKADADVSWLVTVKPSMLLLIIELLHIT